MVVKVVVLRVEDAGAAVVVLTVGEDDGVALLLLAVADDGDAGVTIKGG